MYIFLEALEMISRWGRKLYVEPFGVTGVEEMCMSLLTADHITRLAIFRNNDTLLFAKPDLFL